MSCPNCNKDNTTTFFTEAIPCIHCNGLNNISYNVCQDCGFVWKAIDGHPVSGMVFGDEDTDLWDILGESFKEYIVDDFEDSTATMDEVVHKCLRCDTISYEVKQGLYHCPECGFEWEVI